MQYEIVYADPPFPMSKKIQIAQLVDRRHCVQPDGLFVIHIPAVEEAEWPEQIGELKLIDTRKYGRNMIKFYRNERNAGITLA
jgi:16S rRNA G966 N2-methylase RsmD